MLKIICLSATLSYFINTLSGLYADILQVYRGGGGGGELGHLKKGAQHQGEHWKTMWSPTPRIAIEAPEELFESDLRNHRRLATKIKKEFI